MSKNKNILVPFVSNAICKHEKLVKRKEDREHIVWCGTWYDCPCGGKTVLEPSQALKKFLGNGEAAS